MQAPGGEGGGGGEGGSSGGSTGGGNPARQAQVAALRAWEESNPTSGYSTCIAYEHARAEYQGSLGMDEGFVFLGVEAFCAWMADNSYHDYLGTMTFAEYNAMCDQELSDSIDAARNGMLP